MEVWVIEEVKGGSYSSSHVRGNDLEVSLQQTKPESQSQLDAQCHLWICDLKCIVRNGLFDTREELLPLKTGCSLAC